MHQVRIPSRSRESRRPTPSFNVMVLYTYLLAAAAADGSPVLDASPQLVPLLEKAREVFPPGLAKRPWEDLVLALLLVLLHGVG